MGPAEMNTRYTIEKLNGENYLVWATQLQLVLEAKGLWGYVTGEVVRPGDQAQQSTFSSTIITEGRLAESQEKYDRDSLHAMAEMILNVETKYVVSVISKKTPQEVWNTLRDMNQSQAVATQTTLRRKLLSMKKGPTQSMQEYSNEITSIENQLAASGYKLTSFDKKYALLEGLSDEYDTTRTILREKDDLSFEQIVAKLESREEELKVRQNRSGASAQADTKAFISSGKRHSKIKCHHCKKKGHKKADCYFNPDSKNYKPHLTMPKDGGGESGSKANDKINIAMLTKGEQAMYAGLEDKWFLDTCATRHLCRDLSCFQSIGRRNQSIEIETAGDGEKLTSAYFGIVQLECTVGGRVTAVTLQDVAYVPTMRTNLISVPRIQRAGFECRLLPYTDKMVVMRGGTILMEGSGKGHDIMQLMAVKVVKRNFAQVTTTAATKQKSSLALLHRRLTHCDVHMIKEMVMHGVVDGIEQAEKQGSANAVCDFCQAGKASAKPHKPSCSVTHEVGELLHSDLIGEVEPVSLGGARYILTVLDDASSASWVAFLKRKSDTATAFKRIIREVQNASGNRIKRVRTDPGTEYFSTTLQSFFDEEGICHEPTSAYSPESNGKAERLNRTLIERSRAIMAELNAIHPNLDHSVRYLWAEAVHTVNYVRNRVLNKGTASHFGRKTPY